jgi:hypothetical protein
MNHVAKLIVALLSAVPCMAWSPKVHDLQTTLAKGQVPVVMAQYLDQHWDTLSEAAGGGGNTVVPTPEEVENQYLKVLKISEDRRPAREIARELGVLAKMAQLLTDPSATGGLPFTRRVFSDFADEHYKKLVAVREPLFAVTGSLSPRIPLIVWDRVKFERYRLLAEHIDNDTGARIGTWDTLSVPFAQLQLGFSSGVNATANLWILAWRAVGDLWVPVSTIGAEVSP